MERIDGMVLKTQQYLNNMYIGNPHWVHVEENGKTGWPTIRGLIRALQLETGISTPNGNFGPATEAACPTLKKDFNPSEKTKRLVCILQGAMWCKGFSPGGLTGTFGDGTEAGVKKFQTSAGLSGSKVNGIADPMIFKALLNMDAYVLVSSGDAKIREIQMNLNRDYHKWIGLKPTDGRYGRDTNKAIIYAIQVEEGIAEPNGNFGPQTQSKLPVLSAGSTKTKFVQIAQYALYCNKYDPKGFNGIFASNTTGAVRDFQSFCKLSVSGTIDFQTWASLLVSCGDKDRKGTACDCSSEVTPARAKTLKANGYEIVGRYIAGGEWKRLKKDEAKVIFDNGLRIFPIFQNAGNSIDYFTTIQGKKDGEDAVKTALDYGFPNGTTIYFAVDFDAVDDQVTSHIIPYFTMVQEGMFRHNPKNYKIGIYGARNICSRVSKLGIAKTSFVSDMSTGFSGNLGYPLPENWAFDQIKEFTIGSGDGAIAIDNDIASGRDIGVGHLDEKVTLPPGFTEEYVLDFANNSGMYKGAGMQVEMFNQKVVLAVPSIMPLITVEGEISLVESLKGPHDSINFLNTNDAFTTSFVNSATGSGVDLDLGKSGDPKKIIDKSLANLRITQSVGNVKYYVEFSTKKTISIVLETVLACKSPVGSEVLHVYQRLYVTIHADKYGRFNTIHIPLSTDDIADIKPEAQGVKAIEWIMLTGFAAIIGFIAIESGGLTASAGIKLLQGVMFLSKGKKEKI